MGDNNTNFELAFQGSNLSSICFPNNLDTICYGVCENCRNLKEIIIPNSVETLLGNAFRDCANVKIIRMGFGLKNVSYDAFKGVNAKEIYLEDLSVWYNIDWGYYGYNSCPTSSYDGTTLYLKGVPIEHLIIPEGVEEIKEYSFWGIGSIQKVTLPNSVKTISDGAFGYCKNLINIHLGNCVEVIEDDAFLGCSFSQIDLPESLTKLSGGVFAECKNLKSITIPNSVKNIGEGAFYHCDSLENVSIPNSVTEIGDGAFDVCLSLKNLRIEEGDSILKWLKGSTKGITSYFELAPIHEVFIGRNMIGYNLFKGSYVEKIVVGNEVTRVPAISDNDYTLPTLKSLTFGDCVSNS